MPTLSERLESARRQRFVGRTQELALVAEWFEAQELPFVVLFVYGTGGIGKTSLLREFSYQASHHALRVLQLDGRTLEATPQFFLGVLQQQLNLPTADGIVDALAAISGRVLLIVDTAELLFPLEGWLFDVFLPSLPDNALVIFAGRNPPSLRWRTDPGWQTLMRVRQLKNLSPDESRTLLQRRQVPVTRFDTVLEFTHGHPLALSLVADVLAQRPGADFHPEADPDVVKTLLEQFLQQAPTAYHRAALEACSQVLLLNEPLLGALIGVEDPHPVFDWLRSLSFMDVDARGIYPHDVAREALAADLRWRNPDWQAELHGRARKFYMDRFHSSDAREQRRILNDYIFLHRENALIRSFFEWQTGGVVFSDILQPEDTAEIEAMVRAYEGAESARMAAYWLRTRPEQAIVMRPATGALQGFMMALRLEDMTAADRAQDPGAAAAWRFLRDQAPLRPGETATLFRFWMDRDSYQAVSPTQSRIFLNMVQHYLTTHGLAYTFLPCADPDFWLGIFAFADLRRIPDADFTVGGRDYGVYGHDWRAFPPLLWLEGMAARELSLQRLQVEIPAASPLPVLDEATFKTAVRDALRDFTDALALRENPLLRSRQVMELAGLNSTAVERVAVVQRLLQEATATLQAAPRQLKWYRAVYHTYLQPADTQEQAAELLDLPFSTYRRYLREGIQQIQDWLWVREIDPVA